MDWLRTVLLAGIGVVLWLLVIQWNQFQEDRKADNLKVVVPAAELNASHQLPVENQSSGDDEFPNIPEAQPSIGPSSTVEQLVTVKTDVLDVEIDTRGGDIVQLNLPEHLVDKKNSNQSFPLLTESANNIYIAQSGLIGADGTDNRAGRPVFVSAANHYALQTGDDQVVVDLSFEKDNIGYTKRFIFERGNYAITIEYLINNQSDKSWSGAFYGQIKRDSHQPLVTSSGVRPYLGAALRTTEKHYFKYKFKDMEKEKLETTLQGGWVAMVQHYFIGAWIPPQDQQNRFSLRKLNGRDIFLMGFTGPSFTVEPGRQGEYSAKFYAGPKYQKKLAQLAEYLDLTVDYGFLWMVAKPIFSAMKWIHELVGNWGWAIIFLTMFIKMLLYPLSAASLRSMAKMRRLQPELQRLKELYGDDRQKMSQELMGLYKKERVNPAGGCIPVLLQMPVFLALYWVLLESVEIRHAPWIFWIHDLSTKDPFYILPLIMGASMWFMQRLQPSPPDPTQAKIMQMMPIAFTFFFMLFPAGLVLYWTTNNLLSILQQWYITKQLQPSG